MEGDALADEVMQEHQLPLCKSLQGGSPKSQRATPTRLTFVGREVLGALGEPCSSQWIECRRWWLVQGNVVFNVVCMIGAYSLQELGDGEDGLHLVVIPDCLEAELHKPRVGLPPQLHPFVYQPNFPFKCLYVDLGLKTRAGRCCAERPGGLLTSKPLATKSSFTCRLKFRKVC